MAPAIVFGDLELIQALGRGGIPCVAVAPPGSKVRLSRFVRTAIDAPAPHLIDPADSALADALLRFARSCVDAPVVFCDSDEALRFLSQNRTRLESAMRVPIAEREQLLDMIDKRRFQLLADRYRLPVPAARVVTAADGDPGEIELRFPVVLKPAPHRDARWTAFAGGEKALLVETPAQLSALHPSLVAAGIEVLAQELVPGPEERVVSYHVYVDARGAIAGEFTGRKIRTFPLERGMSTALTTTDDPEVAALGRALVRRLDLRGVAKLDFKRAPDGSPRLLEVNPRFTLWAHPGAAAGVNLPALVHADLTGGVRPPPAHARAGVRWVSFRGDRAAARAAGIPAARWALWAARCETNSAFAWIDPGPVLKRFARARHGAGRQRCDTP